MNEGQYIYCIIGTDEIRNFGPIGIGDRGDTVSTISYRDLSAVVSASTMEKYVVSKENMTAHQRVIEEVMKEYTVLPVRFCTIAASAQEIRVLLQSRYQEFKNLLREMDNKVELGVKGLWKDMKPVYDEISEQDETIRSVKGAGGGKKSVSQKDALAVGEHVKRLLEDKKGAEAGDAVDYLRSSAVSYKSNKTFGDRMFLNAAFLVDRGREKEFDDKIYLLSKKSGERSDFKYVGPIPPYNFVEIVVKWSEL